MNARLLSLAGIKNAWTRSIFITACACSEWRIWVNKLEATSDERSNLHFVNDFYSTAKDMRVVQFAGLLQT